MNTNEYLQWFADDTLPAPATPPKASASGKDAAKIARMMMDGEHTAEDVVAEFSRIHGPGRPRRYEHREPTKRIQVRVPESMERYIHVVVETGRYPNCSAYIKALIAKDQRERKPAAV